MGDEDQSDVEVTFQDGEVKTYCISAGTGIGGYLARERAIKGVLALFNGRASYGIPAANIREYKITPAVPEEPEDG